MLSENEIIAKFRSILKEYGENLTRDEYNELDIPDKPSARTIARRICPRWADAKYLVLNKDDEDIEILTENVRLAKQKQKYMDTNRIERKSFRSYARVENAVEELNKELIDILNENSFAKFTISHSIDKSSNVGILQLSDCHFNELVDLPFNKYDFTVASKRCKKLVEQAKKYFSMFNVSHVLIAICGDILNSDRLLDELLNEASNRSKAMFLAVDIIRYMIIDLNEFYNVTIACVTGNESRITKDIGWSDIIATDNYDFSIFNMLRYLFKDCEGIQFVIGDNYSEQVINIGNKNILIIHGYNTAQKVENEVQRIKGKYASRGTIIDFVIFGHLHSCRLGDLYSRSSSIVGANDYSDKGLGLASRASQNIHIIYPETGNIDSIKIDLQNVDNVIGYNIQKELEEYNIKSTRKLHDEITVFKVVI